MAAALNRVDELHGRGIRRTRTPHGSDPRAAGPAYRCWPGACSSPIRRSVPSSGPPQCHAYPASAGHGICQTRYNQLPPYPWGGYHRRAGGAVAGPRMKPKVFMRKKRKVDRDQQRVNPTSESETPKATATPFPAVPAVPNARRRRSGGSHRPYWSARLSA